MEGKGRVLISPHFIQDQDQDQDPYTWQVKLEVAQLGMAHGHEMV